MKPGAGWFVLAAATLAAAALAAAPGGRGPGAPAPAAATEWTTRSKERATRYVAAPRGGFDVRLDERLLAAERELGAQALAELDSQLHQIVRKVRPEPLARLRSIPIWLGLDDPVAPCACYHPSPEWLLENGFDPQKAKAVEIANAAHFVAWTREQPWMVLHELAHGFDDRWLAAGDGPESWGGRLESAWHAAKAGGRYDQVLHWDGGTVPHYALNTSDEYFAEATEAWFGANDFFPFVQAELVGHDPLLATLLREVWGEPITSRG